ncbi:recombinase family protein [Streptomyces sp. NBC_01373]|uniref:recombinase family protein n=1 Tax=Streptomyces sp. NBC_01373 TaxID=2903843 RepID=UPI00225B491F|nr:recombinase family protein [Streptomyces sp. NBC_01373]MCX4703937.1 recombinase family protein [Streptomyces sp. NBC_01373]
MPYAPEYLHLVITGVRFEAYLYGRNSSNEFAGMAGARDSVDDQLATGRTLCHARDWPIIREFKDSDLSASRHAKKIRDDFEDLITTLINNPAPPGVRRIVVAYEASRYYRDLDAYLRLRKACMASNTLLCYNNQVYDLSRRDDRKATAQHAIDAEDEADAIQDRNARTMETEAQAGKPHGRLPFGFAREYAVVGGRHRCIRQYEHPEQGPIVLKALQHIDAGKSLRSLLEWMNTNPEAARPDGAPWSPRTIRILLTNRAYLGERSHRGNHTKAAWEPLRGLHTPQGRAMFNRVSAKLADPGRRTQRGTEVSHLLTYLALCGECGDHAMLSAQSVTRRPDPNLSCAEARDVSMAERVVNAFVEEAIVGWFSRKDVARAALVPNDEDVAEKMAACQRLINGYEEQLAEARDLAETFNPATGKPRMSATSLAGLEERIQPKLDAEKKKLRDMTGVSPLLLRMLDAPDPDTEWNGLTLDQQRELIRRVVTVRLYKATNLGSTKADTSRIRLSFAGEPGFRDRPLRVPAP